MRLEMFITFLVYLNFGCCSRSVHVADMASPSNGPTTKATPQVDKGARWGGPPSLQAVLEERFASPGFSWEWGLNAERLDTMNIRLGQKHHVGSRDAQLHEIDRRLRQIGQVSQVRVACIDMLHSIYNANSPQTKSFKYSYFIVIHAPDDVVMQLDSILGPTVTVCSRRQWAFVGPRLEALAKDGPQDVRLAAHQVPDYAVLTYFDGSRWVYRPWSGLCYLGNLSFQELTESKAMPLFQLSYCVWRYLRQDWISSRDYYWGPLEVEQSVDSFFSDPTAGTK